MIVEANVRIAKLQRLGERPEKGRLKELKRSEIHTSGRLGCGRSFSLTPRLQQLVADEPTEDAAKRKSQEA